MKKKRDYLSEFISRKINVVMNFSLEETQGEEGTTISSNQPLVFVGELLDFDDDFFYLGDETGEVKQIIIRSKVVALQIDPDSVESTVEGDKNLN